MERCRGGGARDMQVLPGNLHGMEGWTVDRLCGGRGGGVMPCEGSAGHREGPKVSHAKIIGSSGCLTGGTGC